VLGKQPSHLTRHLQELDRDPFLKPEELRRPDRDALFRELLPLAQRRVQERFSAFELADRHSPALRQRVRRAVSEVVEERAPELPKPALVSLVDDLVDDLLGYGPLEPFFSGPEAHLVTEIIVVRWDRVYIEKDKKLIPATDELGRPVKFRDEQHLRDVLDRMLAPTGRRIDLANPRVDARLPDGSRLKAHIPTVAVHGTTVTVRRFRQDITAEKLVENRTLSRELLDFLAACVRARLNIFVSGGTGTGKTTFLNVLASFIPHSENIITIEDPAELQLQHPIVRSLEARPPNVEGKGGITQRELVQDALRMRPDRIIVGECRGPEAFEMLQAMNTGHEGSMSTGHANSADDMLNVRLPSMVLMMENPLPREAAVGMIASAVDLVVHLNRERDGRRVVAEVCETTGIEVRETGPAVALRPIYVYDKDGWVRTGHPFARQAKLEGLLS